MTARATPFAVPLRQPLRIGAGTVAARYGALIEVGDAARPLPCSAVEAADVVGVAEIAWLPQAGMPDWSDAAMLRHGIEAATLDRAARLAGRPLAVLLGGVRRRRIPLNALLTAREPDACAAQAAALVGAGYRCLKLKLAPNDLDGERRRLTALRAAVGPDVALRADANAAWTVDDAIAALRALAPFDLEYVEQPVAGIAALAAVRRAVPMRIAADEAMTGADALTAIIAAGAADVVVLKPTWLGLRHSLALAARAHAAGLAVVVTSCLDTSLGIAAAAHVAAAIAAPLLPCGLATAALLRGDLAQTSLRIERGALVLPDGAGLGIDLDRAGLDRFRVAVGFDPSAALSDRPLHSEARHLDGPLRTDWLAQRAATHAQHAALVHDGRVVTFGALCARADAAGARLAASGVGRGDRVALLLGNRPAFAAWLHGITRVGAVAVPIGARLSTAEVTAQLAACRCRALVYEGASAAIADALPADLVACRIDVDAAARTAPCVAPPLALDAPHSIVFTSGSSGRPKPVLLTAANHLASAVGSALALGLRDDDRWLACLPLHHVGGLAILMRGVLCGVPVVLHERFDPAAVNRAIDDDGVTIVSLVANMLQRLLEARGERPLPAHLRCVLLGGGPAPQALRDDCARRGVPVTPTYGMTETASQLVTSGRPLLGATLRIVRDGAPVAPGEVGRIEAQGPMVSPGCLTGGDLTPTGDWLRTNDLGRCDSDGRLHVVGRADDVLITGGENVHPREVEQVLEAHPAVAEACVFGLPDATWGETVAACVRLQPGKTLAPGALAAHARARLASFKVPRRIEVVADFPRSASGKIQRRSVRQAALGT